MRISSFALPEWLQPDVAAAGAAGAAGHGSGQPFLSSWMSPAERAGTEVEEAGIDGVTSSSARAVAGGADAMHFACLNSGEMTLTLARLAAASSESAPGGLTFALSSVTAGSKELAASLAGDVGSGKLEAPISLLPLCTHSSLVAGAGDGALLVKWMPMSASDEETASIMPLARTPVADPSAPSSLSSVGVASLMPDAQLAIGDFSQSYDAAWLELSPLMRGEVAFTLAHPRATPSRQRGALGLSMPPEDKEEGEGESGESGEQDGDGSNAAGGQEAQAATDAAQKKTGPPPIPATPTLAPSIVHALEASTDAEGVSLPPALQLIDLQDGTYRSLPLLPAAAERADESSDSAGRGSIGRRFGFGGGSEKVDPRAMEVARLTPVPPAAGGGVLSLHRNGELVLWQTHHRALAKGVDEWKRIAGYKDGGDGEGGGGGGLSIVRDFESTKPASMPKRGKIDKTGAPHVGGNTWAGGTGGRDTAGLGGKGACTPLRPSLHPTHANTLGMARLGEVWLYSHSLCLPCVRRSVPAERRQPDSSNLRRREGQCLA